MPYSKLPVTLPILPGLRWAGKLKVETKVAGGYQCQFDAEDLRKDVKNPYIYDRYVLTTSQIHDWTGVWFQ